MPENMLHNFLKAYYNISCKSNSRVQQMHMYNITNAFKERDYTELKEMYNDVIQINSNNQMVF